MGGRDEHKKKQQQVFFHGDGKRLQKNMAMKFEPKKRPGIRKNPPPAAPKVGRLATPRLSKEGLLQRGRKFCQLEGVWSYGYDWPWHVMA